ncbi:hypothetical protein CFC21_014748 [Triticum aestivum]|uniref:PGG domain-containing protein n=2 Tax=Triticum aestivum TaxID=4565 RepID=A0A9R1DVI6_WHEAT|nr:hypothetical protein CFC21_014748 [Triticum aestivum]
MQCKELPASKMTDITICTSSPPSPDGPATLEQAASIEDEDPELLYELKEQLLLLTTLVATVTYVTGLNLPGGAWQTQQADGHLAGDPILRDIHYRRYLAFYYCNGTALASSVVVCLILVMLQRKRPVWTLVLRVVMVLDLLGLMGSYAAGTCHDTFATIWAVALACPVLAYITFAFVTSHRPRGDASTTTRATATGRHEEKEKIEVLMLLATFAVTISYAAGLNPPGGFWTSTLQKDARLLHLAGDPIMEDSALRRYRAFFVCNTTAFVASLFIIPLLLDKKLSSKISARFLAVYGFIAVALLGLMGAYAAGSCRKTDSTVKVIFLAAAVPACVGLQLALSYAFNVKPIKVMRASFSGWLHYLRGTGGPAGAGDEELGIRCLSLCQDASALEDPDLKNTRYFVMVLASFAVSITYQAGLDPPGGLWQDKLDGHKIGQPVLRTTHPTRYQVFFYSNSAAFVTSLVVVMMVQSKFLLKRRTLVAAMVLDLLGLVIAYAAGCTRDTSTSIYVVAVACLVLSYAVVHISLGGERENMVTRPDHDPDPAMVAPDPALVAPDPAMVAPVPATPAPALPVVGGGQRQPRRTPRSKEQLDDKRQVLLLIAILAAALTYQAGLTPPGGFWQVDDEKLGHRAGYPVLLDNYPRRYKAFFYCNAASFMSSVALILLLVNRKLYRPGIRCYALHVCMAVGMFALMGAYAAGSSRHLKTSIYVLTLVAVVSASIPLQVAIFWYFGNCMDNRHDQPRIRRRRARGQDDPDKEKDEELEYLMLLAVLAASVTYQNGLRPAGGMWQEDSGAYTAGNPILRDINKRRYDIFLYSNSTSFMASVVAIVMLLPLTLSDDVRWLQRCLPFHRVDLKWSLWPVHTAILLDMLGLLVAYAAGGTRKWGSSRNVILIVLPVLAYIALYAMAAAIYIYIRRRSSQSSSRQAGQQAESSS